MMDELRSDRILILRRRDSWIATRFGLRRSRKHLVLEADEQKYVLDALSGDGLTLLGAFLAAQGITYKVRI